MKLIFLGTGSAFTTGEDNYHSNMLLIAPNDKKLLIDCGADARTSLARQGFSYCDINDVYISHLHSDHAGGLEWLGFTHKFDPTMKPARLYINEGLVNALWNNVLSGGMRSLQGEIANLATYFDVHPIPANGSFEWNDITLRTVQTVHIMDGFKLAPSFGLLFEACGKKVFITTDTQFAPHQIMDFYKTADLIFHDCETADHPSGVHAHYSQLCALPPEIKRKMWLYHYNPKKTQDPVSDGFLGFVVRGQEFDFS
jgi:ribonuclease BN (tRNA processing enzyme)